MGVRVIEDDDDRADNNNEVCGGTTCFACGGSTKKTKNDKNNKTETTESLGNSAASHKAPQQIFSTNSKDLIGNCKEFRIEQNKSDLRIIGNGNRIRIGDNTGSLQIIGNSTRLKIVKNGGSIKYTGNDGRICLGSDSTQQQVDYIGCNGVLKIKNVDAIKTASNADETTKKSDTSPGPHFKKLRVKSVSCGGNAWQQFDARFQHTNWQNITSMPNLKTISSQCKTSNNCNANNKHFQINNNTNIVNNLGNILIQNSVNVNV